MARSDNHLDALILGEHPAAYFTAALLRTGKSPLRVLHATLPGPAGVDRLVLINPAFFDLHPILKPLRKKLELTAIYGLQFLADDPAVHSEHRAKSALGFVGRYQDIRGAMTRLAEDAGARLVKPAEVRIHSLDENGLNATVGNEQIRARALILGGKLSEPQSRLLGLPEAWEREVMHRYCFARLPRGCEINLGSRPVAAMSLDLKQTLCWAWLLPHGEQGQVSISVPLHGEVMPAPAQLLNHWVDVLRKHKILTGGGNLARDEIQSMDLPLAGAMSHEGVANRTLLVGPAGGFYSACAEDIYPNCWSAIFSADALRKALKATHLQDALQDYRHQWRTTLGDYLRGPQQNLRFLLPLIYRNQVMATRMAESILLGKSVVR